MTADSPRQPPRFVPTLTEVVAPQQGLAPAVPSAPSVAEPVHPVDLAAQIDQKINDWLDHWLAEQAPLLLEQMLEQLASQLRKSLQQQALETVAHLVHGQGNPSPANDQSS